MKSIGDRRITIKLQEVKDIPPELLVGTINKVLIINVATCQGEEVMILKEVIQQRK